MLVKWGSIIVKGSGKLGGHVYSSGSSGASVHTSARAKNPQSKYQMEVRSRFTKFAQGWRDLTESQRESWYDAEESFSRTNRFGDVVTLSGKNLYESLNANRAIIALGVLNTAPLPSEIPTNLVTYVEFKIGVGELEIEGNFVGLNRYVLIGTPRLSQGVASGKKSLRNVRRAKGQSDGTRLGFAGTLYNGYVARFGIPAVGEKIFIGTYSINESGQRSTNSTMLAVISP